MIWPGLARHSAPQSSIKSSELRSSRQGAAEGQFVGLIQAASGGQSLGEASDGDGQAAEETGQVVGGCFTFHVGAQGEDDFRGRFGLDALEQGIDAQVLGSDMIERRDASAERVVEAAESSGALQR